METVLYVVIAVGVVLVIIGLVSQRKGHRRHSSDGGGSDSWDSDSSDSGGDSGCGGGCGGGD
jgi:hypothetical protein